MRRDLHHESGGDKPPRISAIAVGALTHDRPPTEDRNKVNFQEANHVSGKNERSEPKRGSRSERWSGATEKAGSFKPSGFVRMSPGGAKASDALVFRHSCETRA